MSPRRDEKDKTRKRGRHVNRYCVILELFIVRDETKEMHVICAYTDTHAYRSGGRGGREVKRGDG